MAGDEPFGAGDGIEWNAGGFRGRGEGDHDAGLTAFGGLHGVESAAVGGQRVGGGDGEGAGTAEETGGAADGQGQGAGEIASQFVLPMTSAAGTCRAIRLRLQSDRPMEASVGPLYSE